MKTSIAATLFLLSITSQVLCQTTNSIPPNLFLTDDGAVFSYRHKDRLVSEQKIHEAKQLKESLPAESFPEGNWGIPTNGFQVSLRFGKTTFTNSEPVIAVVLMRNVSEKQQVYYRPLRFIASRDGKALKRKNDTEFFEINVPPTTKLFPQTQHKYRVNLADIYDLHDKGEYVFQAVCQNPNVKSARVPITIEE